jgi:phosphopantothenoylcysteine decarboxylase/phosphopantothenate--cysteine ligase
MNAGEPRRIILGVTGGIAAYKSPDLVRRLLERGAAVQVVMTAAARNFVTPMTFQAVSGRPVRSDLWDQAAEAAMGHIELARWADHVLIAPASADFLARLAHGIADDLLTTICLATAAPIMLAPAMNRLMWSNAATQANAAVLRQRGMRLLGPATGEQACGETGAGRMLEPREIAESLDAAAAARGVLAGLRVIVTAGPTRERIDPVRFISNRSSGKMGFAVASAAREAGADVTLICGPVSLETPYGVRRVDVESANDMRTAVHSALDGTHILIAAAAVADYQPAAVAGQKIKKTKDDLELELTRAPDVLASVTALPRPPFTVGFAAETEKIEEHALIKLEKKRLDMIAANRVGNGLAFDCDDNALTVLWPGGSRQLAQKSKEDLARELIVLIADRYQHRVKG